MGEPGIQREGGWSGASGSSLGSLSFRKVLRKWGCSQPCRVDARTNCGSILKAVTWCPWHTVCTQYLTVLVVALFALG